jgi:DNA-binding NarL/FixJ family response regulator
LLRKPNRAPRLICKSLHDFFNQPKELTMPQAIHPLTERELQVLRLICAGYKTKEVARLLNLEIKTVEAHRFKYRRKLSPQRTGMSAESTALIAERAGLLVGVELRA